MNIRLIRTINAPTHRGPSNGMCALQKALQKSRPAWLHLGGLLRDGEIPWFWCWKDRPTACAFAAMQMPFILGPNMLFVDANRPCSVAGERELCDAASCRLQFTESAWYRELIFTQSGHRMRAPIVLWPYPIDPQPGGPLAPRYDLLIYEKSGFDRALVDRLLQRWPASVLVRYGRYQREQLLELARQSRVCIYLSNDDRGPLALAEILLSGCPAVGIPRGSPWIEPGQTGFCVPSLNDESLFEIVESAMSLDRHAVRVIAQRRFDTQTIVQTILAALDAARQ